MRIWNILDLRDDSTHYVITCLLVNLVKLLKILSKISTFFHGRSHFDITSSGARDLKKVRNKNVLFVFGR
jgi:hypothetical protein